MRHYGVATGPGRWSDPEASAGLATLGHLMRGHDDLSGATVRRAFPPKVAAVLGCALLLAASSAGAGASGAGASGAWSNPPHSISPAPNYLDVCAPVGADTSLPCLRTTLQAIDAARAREGIRPMLLPADFSQLTVPEQLFVAVNRERVDRGLAPFAGLAAALDAKAQKGADTLRLPPRPGRSWPSVGTEWINAVDNGLDADYQWMYNDGPDSGVPGCSGHKTSGCWADRDIVLHRFGSNHLAMGAAFNPSGDTTPGDKGGSSLAAMFAVDAARSAAYVYTWKSALEATTTATLHPLRSIPSSESGTGIPDPASNVPPVPDFTSICANGLDNTPACIDAVLGAVNHAHALEGVRPMVLPADFAQLSVPDQLLVAVNLERVDRGLSPFGGLTAALNKNAQQGADHANDPPDAGRSYVLEDSEWAGGSSNGLDAVYGWMYFDGFNSGNLDCMRRGASGCWGHRKGILDDFGSGANLVMGAALNASGDTHKGDARGTSMAVTLAVADAPVRTFTYGWAQVVAALPPGSP